MFKKIAFAAAIALAPTLALAAPSQMTDKAFAKQTVSAQNVRDMLSAQGALHVSPVKRISANTYETKILTNNKGWTKVYVDATTGKEINDPLYAFRKN
ncbi:MAG: PepSY domain-containing protein [Alphaproteobacteria bacterium]|nr:PepSY domain-containing protein [Alphaproteobacteria bacterium]